VGLDSTFSLETETVLAMGLFILGIGGSISLLEQNQTSTMRHCGMMKPLVSA
jgi:hypothetical protein